MNNLPWEHSPDLSEDKIKGIAQLIQTVRSEIVDLHDEILGDTPLSLGTRAYECCRSRIIALAKSNSCPWLSILTEEGRFTFQIGKTPVRFTRNDPKDLPSKKLIPSQETIKQLRFFDIDSDFGENSYTRWFFVVDTPYKVPAENIFFVGYRGESGEIVCQWTIPLEESVYMGLSLVGANLPQPVELPPAPVMLKPRLTGKSGNGEN